MHVLEQVTEVCVLRVSYSACLGSIVTEVCVLRVSYSACLGSKLQSCVS